MDAEATLDAAVSAKIEDGNISAAVRLLSSDDVLAPDDDDTFSALKHKHPTAAQDRRSLSDPSLHPPLQVSEAEVLRAIRSFPAGSAGGPDGVRPQHIVDLVSNRESGSELLSAITTFTNTLLDGKCHTEVVSTLFGGNLIALKKKAGGIRPIAVGYTWRRIAAKCAAFTASARLCQVLGPRQLGVGIPGGCEAAVHATRRFLDSLPSDHVIAKLDFSNAFNSIRRDAMLDSVARLVPEIYRFCHISYSSTTSLKIGNRSVDSQEGAQQGDPLGPLLFCITINPMLSSLKSDLVVGFLDDITIGGPCNLVSEDIERVRALGGEVGLTLNEAKCEIISSNPPQASSPLSKFTHVTPAEAVLLGAPLGRGPAMDLALQTRCDDLGRAVEKLKLLSAHDSLILLRSCFSSTKVMHLLRSSPCADHPGLTKFDELVRSGVVGITNSSLSESQWVQASLPVKDGGLGIRRVASLASSAFLASAASTHILQEEILTRCNISPDPLVDTFRVLWESGSNQQCPSLPSATLQSTWDRPNIEADKKALLAGAADNHHRARLLAVMAPHSGDWLHALPISSCGLRLDDEAIRVSVSLRLGVNLCEPHLCPCGALVDARGTHGLACRRSSGRMSRHQNMNDIIWRGLVRAGIPSCKEPSGLSRTDGKRPDGLTLIHGAMASAWCGM